MPQIETRLANIKDGAPLKVAAADASESEVEEKIANMDSQVKAQF